MTSAALRLRLALAAPDGRGGVAAEQRGQALALVGLAASFSAIGVAAGFPLDAGGTGHQAEEGRRCDIRPSVSWLAAGR